MWSRWILLLLMWSSWILLLLMLSHWSRHLLWSRWNRFLWKNPTMSTHPVRSRYTPQTDMYSSYIRRRHSNRHHCRSCCSCSRHSSWSSCSCHSRCRYSRRSRHNRQNSCKPSRCPHRWDRWAPDRWAPCSRHR